MEVKIADYKGSSIRYNSSTQRFEVITEGTSLGQFATQKEAEGAIDKELKSQLATNPVTALRVDYDGSFYPLRVTSYNPDTKEVWVVRTDKRPGNSGSRSKDRAKYLRMDTPENRQILTVVAEKRRQALKLSQEVDKLMDSLAPLVLK